MFLKNNIKKYVEVPILPTGIFENFGENISLVAYGILKDISKDSITFSPGAYGVASSHD